MASLFPIGTIAGASSSGTIDSISYSLFEPNSGCLSNDNYSTLVEDFENKTLFTRQKALPFLSIVYTYTNIWTKEYNQLRHFANSVDDALTSFLIVDWSKGQDPSAISGTDWSTGNTISIDDTKLYSATTNYKSNNVLIWDGGSAWKIGVVTSVSTNTSITVNVTGNNYGSLTYANAVARGYIYPIYTCFLTANSLTGFSKGEYVNQPISLTGVGGFLYSGSINFRGKYKI